MTRLYFDLKKKEKKKEGYIYIILNISELHLFGIHFLTLSKCYGTQKWSRAFAQTFVMQCFCLFCT